MLLTYNGILFFDTKIGRPSASIPTLVSMALEVTFLRVKVIGLQP